MISSHTHQDIISCKKAEHIFFFKQREKIIQKKSIDSVYCLSSDFEFDYSNYKKKS